MSDKKLFGNILSLNTWSHSLLHIMNKHIFKLLNLFIVNYVLAWDKWCVDVHCMSDKIPNDVRRTQFVRLISQSIDDGFWLFTFRSRTFICFMCYGTTYILYLFTKFMTFGEYINRGIQNIRINFFQKQILFVSTIHM